MQPVVLAFSLTIAAGLATGIGSAIAFFARRTNTRFLSIALGFSAGVMIYVSFVKILSQARLAIASEVGDRTGAWVAVVAFFAGIALAAGIDRLVPAYENPHETRRVEDLQTRMRDAKNHKLMRMGIFSAIAIAVHNFPEGLATFVAALNDPVLGGSIAIAISLHNIPEGIAVAVPVYYATGSRRKAFLYSFLSGLAEPVGALVGYLLLLRFFSGTVQGVAFGVVAGIMVFISLDELLPMAREYGEHHLAAYGLIGGMGAMALSLLLFMS
jgi:ZIP family zinc transporter